MAKAKVTDALVRRIIGLANGKPINAYDAEGEKDKKAKPKKEEKK